MNTFVASPDLALSIAHRTIADRVEQAHQRSLAPTDRRPRTAGLKTSTPRWFSWRPNHAPHPAH